MALQSKWFTGVDKDKKEKHEETIRASRYVLDILTTIIKQRISELEVSKYEDYNTSNWSHLTADKNGALRELKNLLKLTLIDQKE